MFQKVVPNKSDDSAGNIFIFLLLWSIFFSISLTLQFFYTFKFHFLRVGKNKLIQNRRKFVYVKIGWKVEKFHPSHSLETGKK